MPRKQKTPVEEVSHDDIGTSSVPSTPNRNPSSEEGSTTTSGSTDLRGELEQVLEVLQSLQMRLKVSDQGEFYRSFQGRSFHSQVGLESKI